MELSFLTIVISLAVCSLLVYAVFQYTKVRLNIVEHSQKEQALILQEFIEESSTDIHRLYTLSGNKGNQQFQPQGSIILEYANDLENNESETASNMNMKQSMYNEPHMIHLDTAIFQNKRSNLIEISSDSEDTTDSESESGSESESESGSDKNDSDSDSDSDRESDKIHPDIITEIIESVSDEISEIGDNSCETEIISSIKLVTVDLGVIQDPLSANTIKSSPDLSNDVVSSMLYKKIEEPIVNELSTTIDELPQTQASAAPATYSSMSVSDLRQLLKEKYKHNPEKHPEIQKLKKAELIYALQNSPPA
jgi:hypothetical protein